MALVNHTLTSLAQGVSQQHEEARFESQVEEMINCIPDISRGVYRRNPLNDLGLINNTASFSSSPDFYQSTIVLGDDRYLVTINNNNQITVTNLADGSLEYSGTSSYLAVPPNGRYPDVFNAFETVTANDYTFIANRNTTIAKSTDTVGTADEQNEIAIYWIKTITNVASVTQNQTSADGLQTVAVANYTGHTYTLNGESVTGGLEYEWNSSTSEFDVVSDLSTAELIAAQLASQLGTNYAASGSFVYWVGTGAPTEWEWSDDVGSSVSSGFNGTVANTSGLPARIDNGVLEYYLTTRGVSNISIYVSGGTDDNVGYWLKYDDDLNTWVESTEPGLSNELDASTMPHVLVRDDTGTFHFIEYTTTATSAISGITATNIGWKDRLVGDETTAKDPSFVGKSVDDMFFYQNRLGFVARENILLSAINNYGNFYPTTVRTSVDSDVIDLTLAGQNISSLRYIVEIADRLIAFSDTTQYAISANGPLSPNTTIVTIASKYNFLPNAKPLVVGDSIYFVSSVGDSERLYRYTLSVDVDNKFIAEDVTLQCPTYIQNSTSRILGHSTIGYVVLLSYGDETIYVHNNTTIGEKSVQSATHRWDVPMPVVGGGIVDNLLYLSLYDADADEMYLTTLSLNTPVNYDSIDYLDTVNGVETAYNSLVEFSEWQIKQDEFGTRRGRLQIRTLQYSVDEESSYTTVITNEDLSTTAYASLIQTGHWDDTLLWVDSAPWSDTGYKFSRYYYNDDKITVMGKSNTTRITFKENENNPEKGFNLKTVNYEGEFYQRSQRY
jgi:hypothetical protein